MEKVLDMLNWSTVEGKKGGVKSETFLSHGDVQVGQVQCGNK